MTYYLKINDTAMTCNTKKTRDELIENGHVEISKAEFDRLEDQYYQKVQRDMLLGIWGT